MSGDTDFDARLYVRQLTPRPGVYRMYNNAGDVIYVGKAKNLKKRVSSYFLRASGSPKTEAMVDQIADIEVTITHTEDEALLLESTLIKRHRPRYNIVFRDDKSYPYLYLSAEQAFPRVTLRRGKRRGKGRYFGPFPSASAVRQTQNTVCKLFRLRNCSDSYFANRSRPCLQYQIKRCTAPCVGYISKQDYAHNVADAVDLLEGRDNKLINRLVASMDAASKQLDFEQAARQREKISAIRRLQEQSQSLGKTADFDIVCGMAAGGQACVVVVTIRAGANLGHRSFYPRIPREGITDVELLDSFLGQYYLERPAPAEILVHPEPAERAWLEQGLGERAGHQVQLKTRVRGHRARWLDNARATLKQSLEAHLASRSGMRIQLSELQAALGLDALPMRMECFDISHTRGERAVASCVVFESGAANKSAYRRFNIDGIEPGDDYAALEQAVARRYTRLQQGEAPFPDVLIIDGGVGQLKAAQKALDGLQIDAVFLMSVAKGAGRRPGLEQLFLQGHGDPLILPPQSPALHLIQQIRDEAHRFAITGHRERRRKARQTSVLDEIDGLGPVRRTRLLKAFGGSRQIARASIAELARTQGVSKIMARRIYEYFHS